MNDDEKRFDKQFDNALRLRDNGDLLGARMELESLIEKLSLSDKKLLSHSHIQLGYIWTQIGDQAKREYHFRSATQIAPTQQLASMGLFHALFWQGRLDEALQEMLRFLRLCDSDLYAELLCDGYESDLTIERQALVTEARCLLRKYHAN